MGLCDILGNKITVSASSMVTPENVSFFNVTYPRFANRFDGKYEVGVISDKGELYPPVDNCFTTDYLDISGGKYLYVGTKNDSDYVENPNPDGTVTFGYIWLCLYDAAKNMVGERYSVQEPIAIPENVVYARVTFRPYSMSTVDPTVYFVGTVDGADEIARWEKYHKPGDYNAYLRHENLTYKDKPLHEGKTWVLFGDSITDGRDGCGGYDWTGDNWVSKIAREFGLIVDNRAKSGSNMCISTDAYASVSGIHMLDAFLTEIEAGTIEQPAYITIGFGVNGYDTYVGTTEDTSANTDRSYYGATKYFIEKLREKCPKSVFGFILPHDVTWGSNESKQAGVPLCRTAIKAVCEEYRVPYIDMYTESGITADMLNDGVHIWNEQPKNLYYHAARRFVMGL